MTRRLRVGGRTVELTDEGAGNAPAVVLLHGFSGSKQSWRTLRRDLRGRYHVVAVDLPGHGGTPAARDPLADSLWRSAELVVRALESESGTSARRRWAVLWAVSLVAAAWINLFAICVLIERRMIQWAFRGELVT